MKFSGQIVDQRLTLNESQRKTALTITTPRSSTRSFANDLVPRLSTRVVQGLGPTLVAALKVNDRRGGTRRYLSLSVEGEARVHRRF